MDNNSGSSVADDVNEPAFYTMKVAREFGEKIARDYRANSPTLLLTAFIEGLTKGGEVVVSINQLLSNEEVMQWLKGIGAGERQLRSALNAARKAPRIKAAAETGIVVPPRRRRRREEQPAAGA